jgi:uncharacterized protein YndB with AHSA1/START domain
MNTKHTIIRSTFIEAEPSIVFNALVNVERWHLWTASVKKIELLKKGPFTIGTKVRVYQPRLRPAVWEVTTVEANQSFTWVNKIWGAIVTGGHFLWHDGEFTHIKLIITYEGWLARLYYQLSSRLTGRYMDMEAEGLKKECERNGVRYI